MAGIFAHPAFSGNALLANEDEVLAILLQAKEAGAEEIALECTESLYQALTADNQLKMQILEAQAGITKASVRGRGSTISLARVKYGSIFFADCSTETDLISALQAFQEDQAEQFLIAAAPDLYARLMKNELLQNDLAQAGIDPLRTQIYPDEDHALLRALRVEYIEAPYVVVRDEQSFYAAIDQFAEANEKDFRIVFDVKFFQAMSDSGEMSILEHASRMDEWGVITNSYRWLKKYYSVTYTDIPKIVCRSEEAIVAALRGMGSAGVKEFELATPTELYQELKDNDFSRLKELETEAGVRSRKLSYPLGSTHALYYSEADIVAEVEKLNTLSDAIRYVEKRSEEGVQEITLFCAPELFTELLGETNRIHFGVNGMQKIYDLISHAGISDCDISYTPSSSMIIISIKSYYPGKSILSAVHHGTEETLTDREKMTLEEARSIISTIPAGDAYETAKQLHDALCDRILYTINDETNEDDTAIGAILNGEANCDGYADAFYLLGNLCGLEVRYQHGNSYTVGLFKIPRLGTPITHMWNVINVDDQWYMVDVTWDDQETTEPLHTWFIAGHDLASRMHYWNEDMTVALAETTDFANRDSNEFYVSTEEEMIAAVEGAISQKLPAFYLLFSDEKSAENYQTALSMIRGSAVEQFSYGWNHRMLLLSFSGLSY